VLEAEIRSICEEMADSDLPPSTISIPAVTHHGRIRLGLHRSAIVATPVLAAGAVLAIALSGSLPGLRNGNPAASPGPAPARFNPLIPYAAFGWLPADVARQVSSNFDSISLELTAGKQLSGIAALRQQAPPTVELVAESAGQCQVSRGSLNCHNYGVLPSGELGRAVGTVNGETAYWMPLPTAARLPPPQGSSRPAKHVHIADPAGTLRWQYARGGWAAVSDLSLRPAMHVAATIRFGPHAGTPIRFPLQLTNVPADWQVAQVSTAWADGGQYVNTFEVTAGPVAGTIVNSPSMPSFQAGPPGGSNICSAQSARSGGYTTTTTVIHGYQVLLGSDSAMSPQHFLCAADADGEYIEIDMGRHPAISPADLFADHMRLLGSDPADWTTQPIG
jgi:hypothetical protein